MIPEHFVDFGLENYRNYEKRSWNHRTVTYCGCCHTFVEQEKNDCLKHLRVNSLSWGRFKKAHRIASPEQFAESIYWLSLNRDDIYHGQVPGWNRIHHEPIVRAISPKDPTSLVFQLEVQLLNLDIARLKSTIAVKRAELSVIQEGAQAENSELFGDKADKEVDQVRELQLEKEQEKCYNQLQTEILKLAGALCQHQATGISKKLSESQKS